MSTCPSEELYCAFIDDEMSPTLKKELGVHLSKCEKCKLLVSKYKFIRFALVYDKTPELDLDCSFEKLITRRCLLKEKKYLIFPTKIKYKILASTVASMLLFGFLFMFLRHNSIYDKTFSLYKGEVQFTPIVPMSYRQHGNIITNVSLHNMTSVIKSKKYNKKIYKNFTNAFNNFSCLYTPLENGTKDFAITIPSMNEEILYKRGISVPIYVNLNKDVK